MASTLPEKIVKVLPRLFHRKLCLTHNQDKHYHFFHQSGQNANLAFRLSQTGILCVEKRTSMQTPLQCPGMTPVRTLSRFGSGSRFNDDMKDQPVHLETGNENLLAVARHILYETKKYNVMAASMHPQAVANLLGDLCQAGCPLQLTANTLSGRLWLLHDHKAVLSIVEVIVKQDFPCEVALDLLRSLPSEYSLHKRLLSEIPEMINASLHQLRDLGFSSRNLAQLVGMSPLVLLEKPKTIRSVLGRLKGLFTKSDAMKVAMSCPRVFSQPWVLTNRIFDYAFFTMGYTQPQLVQSRVLACPLQKLQDRHVFLIRAGFFVQVKQKDDPRLNPNPPLRFIVKASDADFALEFGGMSEGEFGTFLAMRELEREEEEVDGSDVDSDSDSDSSDSES